MHKRNNVFKVEMNIAGRAGASKGADKRATACCAIVLCGRGCNAAVRGLHARICLSDGIS